MRESANQKIAYLHQSIEATLWRIEIARNALIGYCLFEFIGIRVEIEHVVEPYWWSASGAGRLLGQPTVERFILIFQGV